MTKKASALDLLPSANPYKPPYLSKEDHYAIKALRAGAASDQQQKRVWGLIMRISAVDDLESRPGPDGDRLSAFAGGKRFVGLQFRKAAELPLELVEKLED